MKHLKTDYRETVHTIELTAVELIQIIDGLAEMEGEDESPLFLSLQRVHWNS